MTNTNYKTFRGIARIGSEVVAFEVVAIEWSAAIADLEDAYGLVEIITRTTGE